MKNALTVIAATLLCAMFLARPANAEGWLADGEIGAGTGLEAGDPGDGNLAWRRARTRIFGGAELRSDETPNDGYGLRIFAEIEQRGGFGAELRYTRWLVPAFGLHAAAVGVFVPETLVGVGFGGKLVIPLGKRLGLFVEPSFTVLPLGSDRVNDGVVLWALLSGGLRVSL